MEPTYYRGNVTAQCSTCNAVTTYERNAGGNSFGTLINDRDHTFNGISYPRTAYLLLRCAGCGKGGLATVHDFGQIENAKLESFLPQGIETADLPTGLPPGVKAEFREAEKCASIQAWRAASGLLRSTLEKILVTNGYTKGSLHERINTAADDGVITEPRRKKAHDEVRVLGNDVLHDEWRVVTREEVISSMHYMQRIAEDLYDDRPSVVAILTAKGRIPTT